MGLQDQVDRFEEQSTTDAGADDKSQLDRERDWCEENGHGRITFAELDALEDAKRAERLAAVGAPREDVIAAMSLEERAQAAFEAKREAVLASLRDNGKTMVYTLTREIEPLADGRGDKYALLNEVAFTKVLRGRHIEHTLLNSEGNHLAVTMSRIAGYSGLPKAVVGRFHDTDIANMMIIVEAISSGKWDASPT